jgi:trigger factor
MEETAAERLKSNVKNVDATRKEVEVEYGAAESAKEYEDFLNAYAERAKIRGFRQGHAPREMVKRMFGPEIEQGVIDRIVPRVLDEVLESNRIQAVGRPVVEDVRFEEGRPLRFKAIVEVWPDFELPPYKRLKLRRPGTAVTDEDIAQSLEELRRKNAEYVPVEGRGVAAGDYAVIELQGRDAKTKRLLPAEKVVVIAGDERNEPAVNENLLGLNIEEERSFTTSYPADHKKRKLAGKTVDYRLKLVSIKEMKHPEANDDFAKHLGEFESLAGLKEKIRHELEAARAKAARREMSEEAVQAVIDKASIELPASVLEEETEAVLKNYADQIGRRAITREAAERIREQARIRAERNLKQHLVIRRIAQAEGLSVTEEEVDQEIRSIAQAMNIPPARARDSFREEGRLDNLRATLLARKVVDFLVDQAIIE